MVRGKKKKNAGRGCVLFLFQRDNVEVCFTCPALHQCTQSLGSTKNILFTAKLCLSTAQEKLSGIFSFSCDFFFPRDLCWIWSHEITHKFSNKPFLSCPNLLSPKWEAQLLTFSSHWWFSVDNFIGHKYLVLLWSRDSCHSDSAQHTSSTKIHSRTKNQKFKNVKNRISCSFTDLKKQYFKKKMELLFQPWLSHGCACWSSPCLWACFAVCIPPFLSAAPPVLFTPHYCALPAFPVADCLARAGFCLFFCY